MGDGTDLVGQTLRVRLITCCLYSAKSPRKGVTVPRETTHSSLATDEINDWLWEMNMIPPWNACYKCEDNDIDMEELEVKPVVRR